MQDEAAGVLPPGGQIRLIAFGAHPDDCEIRAGGTGALLARMGHAVKFVSVTNGDAGHHEIHGAGLAARRLAEGTEACRRLGVAYDVLNNHDGELLPTLEVRRQIIRKIREWRADVVMGPRANDYHPDHRNTGIVMQDAAYMVTVPALAPEVPALRHNPVFLYFEDHFQRPNPFHPDIAVAIDETAKLKWDSLDAHVSQFYEWLPWLDGALAEVPADAIARRIWLERWREHLSPVGIPPAIRESLARWYGAERATRTADAEAFEICEYGAQPDAAQIRRLFPMLG